MAKPVAAAAFKGRDVMAQARSYSLTLRESDAGYSSIDDPEVLSIRAADYALVVDPIQ